MARFRPAAALAAFLCLSQAGCLESILRPQSPNSPRTTTSYSSPPFQARAVNKTVEDYVKRLEQVSEAQALESRPIGLSVRPTAIPVVPLENEDFAGPRRPGPFDSRATRRSVYIPSYPPPVIEPPAKVAGAPEAIPTHASIARTPPSASPTFDSIHQYVEAVQARAAANPGDMDLQLQSRLLLAAAGMEAEALQPIPGLNDDENRKVADLLKMAMALRAKPSQSMSGQDAADRLEALKRLEDQLKAVADLQIPVVKLCSQVDGYGVYVPFARNTFLAGQSQPVIVYCELRNFTITPDTSGMHRTRLNLKLALYNDKGKPAQSVQSDSNIEDVSANRRNDFYLTRVFYLRETLAPGEYTLKITVEDPAANKARSESIIITLVKPK